MRLIQETLRSLLHTPPVARKRDGSRFYDCPFCKGRRKLEVDSKAPIWYCHKCGIGGRLNERPRIPFKTESGLEKNIGLLSSDSIESSFSPCSTDSLLWKYLSKERRLSKTVIRSLRPHHGPSPVRVYFPFYKLGGTKPIYFIGRSILPCFLRYWNPSLNDFAPHRKSTVLWGLHRFTRPLPVVVVCEGIFSACHEPNRVAVLGKTISDEQITLLKQICMEEIVVCFDGGAEEVHASVKAASQILMKTRGLKISIIRLPIDKDPDDLRDITPWFKQRERFA